MKKRFLTLLLPSLLMAGCGSSKNFILCIGGDNVPVGDYAQKILNYYELDSDAMLQKGLLTLGKDVKEVTTQVKQEMVSCGIVYATDAFSADLKVVDKASKEMCGRVVYPAAVINTGHHPEEGKLFLDYLQTKSANDAFEKVGFTPLAKKDSSKVFDNVELDVFAAASLKESLTEITEYYTSLHSNVQFNVSFGSSGDLQKKIQEGFACDVFISAGAKQMNALENEDNYCLIKGTRINLLENKVVLAVPDSNPFDIKSFADMADKIKELMK